MNKKGKSKKGLTFHLVMIIIVISIIISILNLLVFDSCNFLKVNIAQILTIVVAVLIAFWATQKKTEERRIKDQIEKVTYKIQEVVVSPNFVTFDTSDSAENVQKLINMNTRKINNCVTVLKEYSEIFDIKDEINYISEQVNSYRNFVSVKINDLDYLSKSETHLRMLSKNINSKCDYIILKLYKDI